MQSQGCSRNFQPNVFLLHVEISDYGVKDVPICEKVQSAGAAIRGAYGVPFSLKDHFQRESYIRFVIDDEKGRLRHGS
jgi:hypothetical protein